MGVGWGKGPNQMALSVDIIIYGSQLTVCVCRRLLCGSISGQHDGIGSKAMFFRPVGIDVDRISQILYVADHGNKDIRRITLRGRVTTLQTPFKDFGVSSFHSESCTKSCTTLTITSTEF